MNDSVSELFTTWDIPPLVTLALALLVMVYVTGWLQVRRTRPDQLPPWRLVAFLAGAIAIFVAVSSSLDTLSESLLFMHMAQHFVLMSVAPPLIVLGAPAVPLLRGLPRHFVRMISVVFFRSDAAHSFFRMATKPSISWMAMNAAYVGWHLPAAYEFALRSESWHNVEHACFLFTSVLFWWPVIHPWPSRAHQMQLAAVPYLLGADLVNTGVSAFLCFSGRLIYPSYANADRPVPISPLNDQIAAGAFMWVFGSLVFLVPAAAVIMRVLSVQDAPRLSPAAFGADVVSTKPFRSPQRKAI